MYANTGFTFHRLEPGDNLELVEQIAQMKQEGDSHNAGIFDYMFWEWQYSQLPSGQSRIYIVKHNGRIVGYYHVPIYSGLVEGEKKQLAVIQEVAIHRSLRNRGVFRSLSEFAHRNLLNEGIDCIYTFPNKKSIHTFIKYYSYRQITTLSSYIAPVNTARLLRSKARLFGIETVLGKLSDIGFRAFTRPLESGAYLKIHPEFNREIEEIFREYQRKFKISVTRNRHYLNWRYTDKPKVKHYVISILKSDKIMATVILKPDVIFDNPVLILMDFAARSGKEEYLLQLLSELRLNHGKYIQDEFNLIYTSGRDDFLSCLYKIGFIKIPAKFNPRPLNLLVKNCRLPDQNLIFNPDNWRITLSDWEVF